MFLNITFCKLTLSQTFYSYNNIIYLCILKDISNCYFWFKVIYVVLLVFLEFEHFKVFQHIEVKKKSINS